MKTIRTSGIIVALLVLASSALMGSCIHGVMGEKGNGKVVKQDREVKNFNSLEVGGAFTVYLYQGTSESLTVETDENLLDLVVTEVQGDKLVIYTKDKGIRDFTELNIYLIFYELEMIDISGAVNVNGEGRMIFDELHLDGSGASEIRLELEASVLEADFSGASEIELAGKAKSVSFDCSGASNIEAFDLVIAHCELEVSGASGVNINVTDFLGVEVSGAASVKYKGSPKVQSDISGAGSIKSY